MKAIDVHVHYPAEPGAPYPPWASDAAHNLGGTDGPGTSIDAMAAYYESLDTVAVLLNVDSRTNSGLEPMPNDRISDAIAEYPGRFIGFGSVDPWSGKAAVKEIRRMILDLGLTGVKFQPITQAFHVDEPHFAPIWETCQELGAKVLIHMGITAAGKGTPGGRGLHLKYARPIPHLDDIAARYPDLTIIAAHPGWPWHEELLAVAQHKANVYFDLSGWAPKYLPASVVQQMNSLLQDKVLFGSDMPLFSVERWIKEFDELNLKPQVREKVLLKNAQRLFGLDGSDG